ncbi:MAG: cell division protein ZapA [Syntrophaceticus sp.]|nr:cell division protein ZapA [Syntrophaceticus sp.]MDD4782862.1 cell division protein ZapA [Syntrophaceticus sp.]
MVNNHNMRSSESERKNKELGKNRITVKIYDEEYVIMGRAEPLVIEKIANYVDRKMRLVGQKNSQLSLSKIAVLAALNIAEDLVKLHEDYDLLSEQLDEVKRLSADTE